MKMAAHSLTQLDLSESLERKFIATVCEWERIEYGEGKHRIPEAFYLCAKKNRTGFFMLLNGSSLVGYADVWELPEDFYSMLRVGIIDEESIAERYILSRSDSRSGLWYIGSIITDPQIRLERPVGAALAFASICSALPGFFQNYSKFPARILGVGSSPFGKKLLERWGFAAVARDENAIDLRPRFEKVMERPRDADALHLGRREISQEAP